MKLRSAALGVVFLLLGAQSVVAQVQTGSVTGTVTDPQGAVVPGASIVVEDMETGVAYSTTSDPKGLFTVPGLPYGTYSVTVTVAGFRKWTTGNVRVITAQAAIVQPTLEVGDVTETVVVEAGQEILETVTAELQTSIDRKQIVDLPLITRNPIELVGLQAGVTGGTGVRSSVFNGLRGNTNNITQDGINVQDNFIRSDGFFAIHAPTVEMTGEFSISSQNIASDSGAGVGQVRIVTPRGTRGIHGSLFYFHRNDAFNAHSWFENLTDAKKERLRQHRFGFRVGGPIPFFGENRTFFFGRYEGFRESFAQTRNRTVLTQSARNGLFSYVASCPSSTTFPVCGTHPQTGLPVNDGDTVTLDLIAVSARGFSPNPFTMSLINATPLPNNTAVGDGVNTAGHQFAALGDDEDDRYTIRIDHKAFDSPRLGTHWVDVRWHWTDFRTFPDTFNSNEASFPPGVATNCVEGVCLGAGQFSQRKVLSVGVQSTINPTVFNEFRFGFNRAPVGFLREAPFPRGFTVNFPGVLSEPENRFLDQGRITPVYQFIDNFSKVWGSHTFHAGFNLSSTSVVDFNDVDIIPQVNFGTNTQNGHGLPLTVFPGSTSSIRSRARDIYASLVGLLGSTEQIFNAIDPAQGFIPGATDENFFRERAYQFYFSDTWRVRPDLSVNYGVRYEWVEPADAVNKRAVQPVNFADDLFISGPLFTIDPNVTFNDLLAGNASTFLDVAGSSNDRPFWRTDKNNFAPYLGIAWLFNPKTVLRTGFSMSYTRDGLLVVENAVSANDGLVRGAGDPFPNVTLGTDVLDPSANFGLTPPPLTLPISQLQNYLNSGAVSTVFTFDRNLRTPYVLQWSFGLQREISESMVVEARYVGNHAVKLLRAFDLNQIDILNNGLLEEFRLAQENLACNRSFGIESFADLSRFGIPCSVSMPILAAMDFPLGFTFSPTFTIPLDDGEAGEFAHQLQRFATFFFLTENPAFPFTGLGNFPANFFRANPIIFNGDLVGNGSSSQYHGFQLEVRRRLSRGIMFQANYSLGKVLTDFDGSAAEFDAFLDLRNVDFDRRRASFDIRHTFHLNSIWEVPVGRGRAFASEGPLGKILEGWQIGGIWTWRSGRPLGILSGRGTLNRTGRSSTRQPALLVGNLTAKDVCSAVGVHRTSNGITFLPEEFIDPSTGEASKDIFGHPAPGQLGDQRLRSGCSSPRFFDVDLNFVKRTYFTETANFEFRFEIFNVFNTPNFLAPTTIDIDDDNFAQVTDPNNVFSGRQIQFNFRINF